MQKTVIKMHILATLTSVTVLSRCQWYFKAKMTSEEKRRSSYQNGHGKSISPLYSFLLLFFFCVHACFIKLTDSRISDFHSDGKNVIDVYKFTHFLL